VLLLGQTSYKMIGSYLAKEYMEIYGVQQPAEQAKQATQSGTVSRYLITVAR
jgi:hypothetical protein